MACVENGYQKANKEMMGRESAGGVLIIKNLTKGLGDRNLVL